MFSHTHIGTNDFPRAFAFYAALMPSLGCELRFSDATRAWAGWKPDAADRPLFLLGAPLDGQPASAGNGQMIAFLAASRAAVKNCYAIAIANGATDEGAPGLRPHYHPDYFGAYFRDLDGNKICICCHEAEQAGSV
jgi:catechol 2,3-dioxygenase-like lactoylglutathione lyase family enzyme